MKTSFHKRGRGIGEEEEEKERKEDEEGGKINPPSLSS